MTTKTNVNLFLTKSYLEFHIIQIKNLPTAFSTAERKQMAKTRVEPLELEMDPTPLFNFLALVSQRMSSSPNQMAAKIQHNSLVKTYVFLYEYTREILSI